MATTGETAELALEGVPTQMLIGGAWREAAGGETFEKISPVTESCSSSCPRGAPACRRLDAAVRAAHAQCASVRDAMSWDADCMKKNSYHAL